MSAFSSMMVGGVSVLVLVTPPDMTAGLLPDFDLPADAERGLGGPETRTAFAARLRVRMRLSVPLFAGDLPAFRTALQTLQDGLVGVPFWPALCDDASYPLDAAWYLRRFADGTLAVIDGDSRPSLLADGETIVPLLLGVLTEEAQPDPISGTEGTVRVSFEEGDAGSWIDAPAPGWDNGPTVAGGLVPPLCPLSADWNRPPATGAAVFEIERRVSGFRREKAAAYYPQSPVRPVEVSFTCGTRSEWVALLAFYRDRLATVRSFWMPAEINEASLTADVLATDTALALDSIAGLGTNRYLILSDARTRVCVKATSAANPLPLSAAVGVAFSAAATRVGSLILARFAESRLSLSFTSAQIATANVKVREVTPEYVADAGETVGVTLGGSPLRAHLYRFTLMYPGAPQVTRWTSFESDVSDGSHMWTGAFFEHGEIRDVLNLDTATMALRTRKFTGNPLNATNPFTLEFPLQVEVIEADLVAGVATNLRRIFFGEAGKSVADGPFLDCTCTAVGAVAGRDIPRMLYGPRCPFTVYGPGCGLDRAAFTVAAVLTAAVGGVTTITVQSAGSAWADGHFAAHHFAAGLLKIGADANRQARWIMDSTASAGGTVTLTLAQALTALSGAAVDLLPGCDNTYATCIAKFGNGPQFGGFPWMPVQNPSFVSTPNGSSKK